MDWINRDCGQLIADFQNVLTDAIHNTSVPVGEALISFIGKTLFSSPLWLKWILDEQMDGNTQMFVPFCCEVSLSEVDNFDNSDSDCEPDRHGSKTLSPTSRFKAHFQFGLIF